LYNTIYHSETAISSRSAVSYGKYICRPTNHIIAAVARLSIIKFKIFLLHIVRFSRGKLSMGEDWVLGHFPPHSHAFPGPLAGCLFCDACIGLLVLVRFVVRLLLRFIAVHWEAPCIQRPPSRRYFFSTERFLRIPFGKPWRTLINCTHKVRGKV